MVGCQSADEGCLWQFGTVARHMLEPCAGSTACWYARTRAQHRNGQSQEATNADNLVAPRNGAFTSNRNAAHGCLLWTAIANRRRSSWSKQYTGASVQMSVPKAGINSIDGYARDENKIRDRIAFCSTVIDIHRPTFTQATRARASTRRHAPAPAHTPHRGMQIRAHRVTPPPETQTPKLQPEIHSRPLSAPTPHQERPAKSASAPRAHPSRRAQAQRSAARCRQPTSNDESEEPPAGDRLDASQASVPSVGFSRSRATNSDRANGQLMAHGCTGAAFGREIPLQASRLRANGVAGTASGKSARRRARDTMAVSATEGELAERFSAQHEGGIGNADDGRLLVGRSVLAEPRTNWSWLQEWWHVSGGLPGIQRWPLLASSPFLCEMQLHRTGNHTTASHKGFVGLRWDGVGIVGDCWESFMMEMWCFQCWLEPTTKRNQRWPILLT